jgi:hypothetical protein
MTDPCWITIYCRPLSGCTTSLCECNDLNDWASFVLLMIELNLVVYGEFLDALLAQSVVCESLETS